MYITEEEFVRRIKWLTNKFNNYQLKFPILSWTYKHNFKDLKTELEKQDVIYKVYEGSYYDSYAEGDYDHCILTNVDQEKTITVDTDIFHEFKNGLSVDVGTKQNYLIPFEKTPHGFYRNIKNMEELQKELFINLFPNAGKITVYKKIIIEKKIKLYEIN